MSFLTFPGNGFNFVTQKFAKIWKMPFSKAQNVRALPGCFETIFWNAYHDQLWIQRLLNAFPCFHSKRFQLRDSKMCEKLKIAFLSIRFSSISAFHLKVVSKPFSKIFSMSNFGFTQFCMLCLAFPKSIFNLFTEKCAKKFKNSFSNSQKIRFWLQGSFKRFLKYFLWQTLKWNHFGGSDLLSLKTVSTSSPKNLQKSEKCHIWTLKTIVLHLQVASKPFSKMLPTINFGFNVWIYFYIFEGFDFLFWKLFSWYNFVFELKVVSDLLSKTVPIPNLWFN